MLLPLKRSCFLSRSKTAIANPKFGVYITYIYCDFLYICCVTLSPYTHPLYQYGPTRNTSESPLQPPFPHPDTTTHSSTSTHTYLTPGIFAPSLSFAPNSSSLHPTPAAAPAPTFLPPSFLFTRHHSPTSSSQINCQITHTQLSVRGKST